MLVAKYSALIEPILQSVALDVVKDSEHQSSSRKPFRILEDVFSNTILGSMITSLEVRFAEENTPSFALSKLHPAQMQMTTTENQHVQ
ncbi:unnamed protein product [Pieris macdunnoughi]|uniref:Uncharacterized protein n=1 Tax=Pieris macdunnoughi TaxID=345717 RepID=A0A821WFZ7_9NEOP|nr:unnamed protein product [Pieris macdunnoughi]